MAWNSVSRVDSLNGSERTERRIISWKAFAATLPVGFNELLDFVHLSHSASPGLPPSILSFNALDAAWLCNSISTLDVGARLTAFNMMRH
jgi:hypothetical protein